jgi:hypothetical protein
MMLHYACIFVISLYHFVFFFLLHGPTLVPLLYSLPVFATTFHVHSSHLTLALCYVIYRARCVVIALGSTWPKLAPTWFIGGLNRRYSVDKGCSSPIGYRDCLLPLVATTDACK